MSTLIKGVAKLASLLMLSTVAQATSIVKMGHREDLAEYDPFEGQQNHVNVIVYPDDGAFTTRLQRLPLYQERIVLS